MKKYNSLIKIVFFIESLYQGGKERQLVELLKYLVGNKTFECVLVVMRKKIFYSEIYSFGIPIHIIERKHCKKDPVVFIKFCQIVKNVKPNIVHVCGNMVAFYSLLAKIIYKFKLVNFQIQDSPTDLRPSLVNKLNFYFADKIIANSKAGLKEYNVQNSNCNVIYNGFDFNRLHNLKSKNRVRKKYGIHTKYVVGMVARFVKDKDFETYANAANIILKIQKNVTFLFIGSGDKRNIQCLIKPNYFDFCKFFDPIVEIESIMNICDIGVLSTYSEGIPNTIMEFMALGKPTITTAGGGTNELVIDGETGYLIPTKTPNILAEKIQFLLDKQNISNKMGRKSKNRIKSDFSITKMGDNFINLYQNLIEA